MIQSYLDVWALDTQSLGIFLMTAFSITPSLPHSLTESRVAQAGCEFLVFCFSLPRAGNTCVWLCLTSSLSLEHQCTKCGMVIADGHHSPSEQFLYSLLLGRFLYWLWLLISFLVNYFEILNKYFLIPPFLSIFDDLIAYKLLGWKFYCMNFESLGWWCRHLLFSAAVLRPVSILTSQFQHVACFILYRKITDLFPVFCDSQESPEQAYLPLLCQPFPSGYLWPSLLGNLSCLVLLMIFCLLLFLVFPLETQICHCLDWSSLNYFLVSFQTVQGQTLT